MSEPQHVKPGAPVGSPQQQHDDTIVYRNKVVGQLDATLRMLASMSVVKQFTTVLSFGALVILVGAALIGYATRDQLITAFGARIARVQEDRVQIQEKIMLQWTMRKKATFDGMLQPLLDHTHASRAFFMQFHDGKIDAMGMPFSYVDEVAEVTAAGVAPIMSDSQLNNGQNVPTGAISDMVHMFQDRKCVSNGDLPKSEQVANTMKDRGVHRFFACPVIASTMHNATAADRTLVGYVGVSFLEGMTSEETDTERASVLEASHSASAQLETMYRLYYEMAREEARRQGKNALAETW